MHRSVPIVRWRFAAVVCTVVLVGFASAQTSVRSVTVLGAKDAVEIEVEASDRIVPQTRVLTDPDRLVVDFPNSIPGAQLHSQSVDRGEVKNVRVGLFQAKPPITRLVLDLKSAQSYQIFPYGRTVMIKVSGHETAFETAANTSSELIPASNPAQAQPAPPPEPELIVSYRDGLLGIRANKSTLSEVLTAIQQRTGADISMVEGGAEQEQVAVNIEPAPASEVLARLLNGSRFNFLILNSPDDARKLDKVILTLRSEGPVVPLPMLESDPVVQEIPPQLPEPPNVAPAPVQPPPPAGPSNPQPEPAPPNGPNQ